MNDREIRLECLKIALNTTVDKKELVKVARELYDFVVENFTLIKRPVSEVTEDEMVKKG